LIGLESGNESTGQDTENDFDPGGNGWAKRVHYTIPRVEEDEMDLLQRLERKIHRKDGVKTKDSRREGDEDIGTWGDEVATEADEAGFFGPLE